MKAKPQPVKPEPLKPEELNPIVKAALFRPNKHWIDGEVSCMYASDDEQVMFGQVTRVSVSGDWDAFDLQHSDGSSARKINVEGGPFPGVKMAKRAVEDYWSIVS